MATFQRAALAAAIVSLSSTALQAEVLEEVVVTAQKREQSIQDVGISVSAYTGKQIQELGYSSAQEVTGLAPGVSTIQPNGPSNYAIGIRGVAQNDFVTNQESPVSIYVDDVYLSQMSSAGFQLFDLDRVEILRGPQGTLYGRNATGGLAHYVSKKPTNEYDGYAEATGGYYGQAKFQGAFGGPINDKVMARVALATNHDDGYVRNRLLGDDIGNSNDYAGRAQLLILPTDDTELLVNFRGSLQQVRTGFWENVSTRADAKGNGFYTPGLKNFNGYRDGDGNQFAGDYNTFGHQDMHTKGVTGNFKWNVREGLKLTSITDYQAVKRDYTEDSDASPFNDFNFFLVTDADQFSQELRLNGEMERMRWVAGFYYLKINVKDANGAEEPLLSGIWDPTKPGNQSILAGLGFTGPLIDAPNGALGTVFEGDGTPLGIDNPYRTHTDSWSLFGQTEYDLTERFTGIVGFRYIDESKNHHYDTNLVDFQPGIKERNGNPQIIANLGTYDGSFDKSLWSAKAQLNFKPNENTLIYGGWNRGVKGGGFNAPLDVTDYFGSFGPRGGAIPLTDANMKFKEEKLDAYETGVKLDLFGGKARLNASAFYYDYHDYQAFQIVGLTTFITNADAKSHGFEVEFQASPLEGLDFLLGAAYLNVKVKDVDLDGPGPLGADDTKPVQSPKWNLNGLLRYSWPYMDGKLAWQADFRYRSKHYFSLTKAEASTEKGYIIGDARFSYATADAKWEGAIFVNNIADVHYLVQTFDLGSVLGMTEQFYGMPRWVGGSIRYSF